MFLSGRTRAEYWSVLCAAAGLIAVAVGGFLPWVRSGSTLRSSFEAAGVLGRLGPDTGLLDIALAGWIAVPLVCTAGIGLLAVGLARTGAAVTTIAALLTATVAAVALIDIMSQGSGPVVVTAAGPLTTLLGDVVALVGAAGVLLAYRKRPNDIGSASGMQRGPRR